MCVEKKDECGCEWAWVLRRGGGNRKGHKGTKIKPGGNNSLEIVATLFNPVHGIQKRLMNVITHGTRPTHWIAMHSLQLSGAVLSLRALRKYQSEKGEILCSTTRFVIAS